MSKYKMDDNFFKKIDTEYKAYILGFIFADGNIGKDAKGNPNRVRITLNARDSELLAKFKDILKFTGDLRFFKDKGKYDSVSLNFGNRVVAQDVFNLGCTPNKTSSKEFPLINRSLVRHFIRGYFDGNGSVYHLDGLTRLCDIRISLMSGSSLFFDSLVEILLDNSIIKDKGVRRREKDFQLTKSGVQALQLLDYLYVDSSIHLNRKYNKYLEYKSMYEGGKLKCLG